MFMIGRYKHYRDLIGTRPPQAETTYEQGRIQKFIWDERNAHASGKIAFMWLAVFNGVIATVLAVLAMWGAV